MSRLLLLVLLLSVAGMALGADVKMCVSSCKSDVPWAPVVVDDAKLAAVFALSSPLNKEDGSATEHCRTPFVWTSKDKPTGPDCGLYDEKCVLVKAGSATDFDGDGIGDCCDNCPLVWNPLQDTKSCTPTAPIPCCGSGYRECFNGGFIDLSTCGCICRPGTSGLDCAECNLECAFQIPINHNCECECPVQTSGDLCENCLLGTTADLSCLHGSVPRPETCDCACDPYQHWTGDRCEICPLKCQNGGVLNTDTCQCQCAGNWIGDQCETCGISSCLHGGTFVQGACRCDCVDFFGGATCDVCEKPCKNNGQGEVTADGLCQCACDPLQNWSGEFCGQCDVTCANSGVLSNSTCTCSCTEKFGGLVCSDCTLECKNAGSLDPAECKCSCPDGLIGVDCSMTPGQASIGDMTTSATSGAGNAQTEVDLLRVEAGGASIELFQNEVLGPAILGSRTGEADTRRRNALRDSTGDGRRRVQSRQATAELTDEEFAAANSIPTPPIVRYAMVGSKVTSRFIIKAVSPLTLGVGASEYGNDGCAHLDSLSQTFQPKFYRWEGDSNNLSLTELPDPPLEDVEVDVNAI